MFTNDCRTSFDSINLNAYSLKPNRMLVCLMYDFFRCWVIESDLCIVSDKGLIGWKGENISVFLLLSFTENFLPVDMGDLSSYVGLFWNCSICLINNSFSLSCNVYNLSESYSFLASSISALTVSKVSFSVRRTFGFCKNEASVIVISLWGPQVVALCSSFYWFNDGSVTCLFLLGTSSFGQPSIPMLARSKSTLSSDLNRPLQF